MSGSKKSGAPQAPAIPGALPGPVLNVPPVPQPMPGQMELIAQQLGQAYPSMPQAEIQKHLQSIYAPPAASPAATAPAVPAAAGRGLGGVRPAFTPGGWRGGTINSFGEFNDMLRSLQAGRQNRTSR